jgi:hypothetical protein
MACAAFLAVSGFLTPTKPLAAPQKAARCRQATIDGELFAGKGLARPIGNRLVLYFQPIASGWILRVLPQAGLQGEHDYAELATPPYQSVSPLSISTDFAFRAQDAVGWNPRRFRFATSELMFNRLEEAYFSFEHAGATPAAPLQVELANQIAHTSEGTLTILDARLTPGTADPWRAAATVSSHFQSTAHILVQPPDGVATPLGKLLWLRFRISLDLPSAFRPEEGLKLMPYICGTR